MKTQPTSRRRLRHGSDLAGILLVETVLLLGGSPLGAQPRGTVVGTVVEAGTGRPLHGATVTASGRDVRIASDEEGSFRLDGIASGTDLKITLERYVTVVDQVQLSEGDVVYLRVELVRVDAVLEEVLVRVGRGTAGGGAAVAEIVGSRSEESLTAADLLARGIPGVAFNSGSFGHGPRVRIRGSSSISLSLDPAIYVNGVRVTSSSGTDPLRVLMEIPASAVERIRILRGPAAAAQYAEAANGIILIETRR